MVWTMDKILDKLKLACKELEREPDEIHLPLKCFLIFPDCSVTSSIVYFAGIMVYFNSRLEDNEIEFWIEGNCVKGKISS